MANSDKNIIITPSIGSTTADPTISFTGAGNSAITLRVLDSTQGGVAFEGSEGQLLVISNGLTTTPIFAINDKTSIPMMQAWDTGRLYLAPYPGYYVGIGTTVSTQSTYDLEVFGGAKLDDVTTGSGKFNTNISRSISTTLSGVLNPVITLPSTANKRYLIHSINVANIARVSQQGAGATVGISTTTGGVSSFTLTNPGAGYTAGDLSSLDGYSNAIRIGFATASFVGVGTTGDPALAGITSALGVGIVSLTVGSVTGIVTVNSGAGYTAGDVGITSVVFDNTGTGGTGAAATVAIDTVAGIVTNYTITNPGTGYTVAPIITITAPVGGGTQATATAQITLGIVTGTYVTYPGFAYTTAPTATFPAPLATGVTTAVTATGIATLTLGEVTAAYLNVPGIGYKTPPTVSIASTTGTGAVITSEVDSDGRVIRLNLLSRGYGYSKNNGLGNNEENEVYITNPPLAKAEVGITGRYDMVPLGNAGIGTVETYFSFATPIPIGGVVELIKEPMVLNPYDKLLLAGISSDGSGLANAVDVHIAYEEQNNSQYIGIGSAFGSTIGLGTNVSGRLLSATSNPIMLQSLRMTNTEFVGDYDVSAKIVSDVTTTSIGTTAGPGATIFFVPNLYNVTTSSIVSIGTYINKASLVGVGSTSFTIGVGKTSEFSIPVGTGVSFYILGYDQVYLARNLMIPSFASIELFDRPKRLERYSSLDIECDVVGIDANIASTMDVQVSGKNIV